MSLHHRATESGLVVAEEVIGEPALKRALTSFDQRLSLQFRPPYYVVVCRVNDHYAPVIATWMDLNGKPLPLSSGLLEKVKAWHIGGRNRPETVDEFNDRRQAELERDKARALEAIRDDHRPYIERGRVQVSFQDADRPKPRRHAWAAPSSGAKR